MLVTTCEGLVVIRSYGARNHYITAQIFGWNCVNLGNLLYLHFSLPHFDSSLTVFCQARLRSGSRKMLREGNAVWKSKDKSTAPFKFSMSDRDEVLSSIEPGPVDPTLTERWMEVGLACALSQPCIETSVSALRVVTEQKVGDGHCRPC